MRPRLSLALVALVTVASAQTPPNLAAYLKAHPVPSGLTVSAEERRPLKTGEGLARYGRKAVRMGTVTAIVPIDMIEFDDSLRQEPNLYDGLPPDAKVAYLLSTLSPQQWKIAGGDGLGLGDLKEEQGKVFLSILPKRVGWRKYKLDAKGDYAGEVGKGEIAGDDVKRMKLRFERQLSFEVPLPDDRGYTFRSVADEPGKPNSTVLLRDTDELYDRSESFGIAIRKTVPNAPKKGQLDKGTLNALVTVPAESTVGAVLKLVGAAGGGEIFADLRVRDRKVTFGGSGKVRAGDVLDALALAVEGTYRRIGSSFILASDVVGLGARKLRLSVWEEDLNYLVRHKVAAWKNAVKASGGVANVEYDDASGLAPSPEMVAEMAARKPEDFNKWSQTSDYPPVLREFLERSNERYKSQPVDTTRARAKWSMVLRYVTPDGDAFPAERIQVMNDDDFGANRFAHPQGSSPAGERVKLDPSFGAGLALAARTPEEAAAAVALAKRYGFAELWLTTTRKETLAAALGTRFPVRLVVRPWAAEPTDGAYGLDRTILGDTAAQAFVRIRASEATVKAAEGPARTGWEREPLVVDGTNVLSPGAPTLASRMAGFVGLANTPGLKGVVFAATQPRGYEGGPDDGPRGIEREELLEEAAMGYTEAARLAFIRKNSVDPIDLSVRGVRFSVDLRPPFFLDDALRGSWTVYDGSQEPLPEMATMRQKWKDALATENEKAVERLLAGTSAAEVWVGLRGAMPYRGPQGATALKAWTKGEPLPNYSQPTAVQGEGTRFLFGIPTSGSEAERSAFLQSVGWIAKSKTIKGAFDLGTVAPSRWEATLGGVFERP